MTRGEARLPDAIFRHLAALYEPQACQLRPRLAILLESFKPARPVSPRSTLPLTERDALLITYPDQVREPSVKPLKTLASLAGRYLRGLISGIHLLPFYPWSSDDGFSVKDYFSVEPEYGTWDDITELGTEFDLMFDAVFNHLSAQSAWFQGFLAGDPAYANYFITVEGNPDLSTVIRPRALPLLTVFDSPAGVKKVWTTFSRDQVDLNFKNPDVLLAMLEVLLFYLSKGVRFLRLDAIAFLWKELGTTCLHRPQTHEIVRLLRSILDQIAPDVLLITETNVPHLENLSYFGDGTNEAQLVYNFGLPPLVLHSLLTGEAGKLTTWAQSLRLPSDRVTFFNFLASHDGIGLNPARGILGDAEIEQLVARTVEHGGFISFKQLPDGSEIPYELNINYLDALSNPATGESPAGRSPADLVVRKFLVAQAIMLSLQGVPGIYFHSLFGSRGDKAGAEASGIKRRINRQKLDRRQLEAELADASSLRHQIFHGYCELLSKRREHAAFAPASPQRVLALHPRLFAVLRETPDGSDRVLCLHNVSDQPVSLSALPGLETPLGRLLTRGKLELSPFETRWLPLQSQK